MVMLRESGTARMHEVDMGMVNEHADRVAGTDSKERELVCMRSQSHAPCAHAAHAIVMGGRQIPRQPMGVCHMRGVADSEAVGGL